MSDKRVTAYFLLSLPLAAQTGQIQGQVVDDKGAPVANIVVSAHARYSGPATKQYDSYFTTQADGKFQFTKVPGGLYDVCAQAGKTDWVPTCTWSKTPLRVTLTEGQSASVSVPVRKGHILKLKFNDAGGLLDKNEKSPGEKVLVLVQPGAFGPLPMYISASDARSREYATTIPFDTDVEIFVRTSAFQLRDARAAAVDARTGHRIPVRATAAARPAAVELTVAGLAP